VHDSKEMRLLVLRHAEAEPAVATDAERALTPMGLEQAARVGAYCRWHDLLPQLVLTSPYRRTVQTGEIVAAALEGVPAKAGSFLASGMQPLDAMEGLREYRHLACLLIVGHQPDLGLLTASLLGMQEAEHVPFKLASLAGLRIDRFAFFGASLEFFVPLALM
jgi:phosphohistidine phosphatase